MIILARNAVGLLLHVGLDISDLLKGPGQSNFSNQDLFNAKNTTSSRNPHEQGRTHNVQFTARGHLI